MRTGYSYAPGEAQVGLADRVFARYQGLVEEEYAAGLRAQAAGRLTPPPGISAELHLGQYVDRAARTRLIGWLRSEGIGEGPGELIQVNRYLRDPLGSGAYRIPDIGIPGSRLIFDGTISSSKTIATPQMIDFIALVVLHAPEEFPKEDWLKPEEQLNLDRAFDELRYGLDRAAEQVGGSPVIDTCRAMLDEADTHYREGRINPGAWKLQEMSCLLEKL